MCELFRSGMTLQQIGTAYGLTRERVRQIIAHEGVTGADGGVCQRKARRLAQLAKARLARLNVKASAAFGCDYETAVALNGGRAPWTRGGYTYYYLHQRRNARKRGIEWQITLPEWVEAWRQSGRWDSRGLGKDKYVMARRNDLGPYASWNVYITTSGQNAADYQAELKRRGVLCPDGYKRLPERAAIASYSMREVA